MLRGSGEKSRRDGPKVTPSGERGRSIPELTVSRALTEWTLDPWMLALVVVLGRGYLAAARRACFLVEPGISRGRNRRGGVLPRARHEDRLPEGAVLDGGRDGGHRERAGLQEIFAKSSSASSDPEADGGA